MLSVSGGVNKPPKAGSYAFEMTAYVAGALTGLNSTDSTPEVTSSNNTIQVTVDGVSTGVLTIPASHYSSQGAWQLLFKQQLIVTKLNFGWKFCNSVL